MQEMIGFDNQGILSGTCAQRSLVHALLLLGISLSEREAHRATDTSQWKSEAIGTDEKQLKRGVRKARCMPVECETDNEIELRQFIEASLTGGHPVIIATDNMSHWAVLAGKKSANEYYWIDSADPELYGSWHWKRIADRMCDDDDGEYYCISVRPKNEAQTRHSLVHCFSHVYQLFDDPQLAEWWGYYLEDLNEIFDNPRDSENALTAREFFQQYEKKIFNAVSQMYEYTDDEKLRWELRNYRLVAEAHALTLSQRTIEHALIKFTTAITTITCTE